MRLLITRPKEDAEPLAALVRARGFETVLEPLLTIQYGRSETIDLDDVQGVLLTSANGARALARVTARRDVPLLAVGAASANAARELGFAAVEESAGDVAALAGAAAARFDPHGGALLHVAGTVSAGDLAGLLEGAGFSVRRQVLYEARQANALSRGLRGAIAADEIGGVLLYSPRTAALFVTLLEAAGLAARSKRMAALCLSQAVAAKVAPLQWLDVLVAAEPEQEALLSLLDEIG